MAAEELSHLIGAIYDCAVDPGRWPATLDSIMTALRCANAALTLQALPSGQNLLNVTTGIPQAYLDMLPEFGPEILEQWGGPEVAMSAPLDEPGVLTQYNPTVTDPEKGSRYYREWGRPQGLIDTLAVVVARDPHAIGTIGFGRHEDAGPIGERELALARLLIPHLQRAVAISRLLDVQSIAATTFEAALDALSTPVVLTGRKLEIVHANRAAKALLAEGELIGARGRILTTASTGLTAALAAAVVQAATDESAIGRKGFGIPASDDRNRLFHVLPLRFGALRPSLAPGAVAAIFIGPSATRPEVPAGTLAALFGLTPAEVRVFEQIAAGRSVAEAADRLGVAPSTVRTHLLRLFDKVGVHRQAELVALAASLGFPLRPPASDPA